MEKLVVFPLNNDTEILIKGLLVHRTDCLIH